MDFFKKDDKRVAMQKLLTIIIGGIADHAVDGLGRRTPLQVARTPNLDHLSILGGCGVYHPTAIGEAVSPDYSLYIMLGNPPERYPGRAAFEALGRGLKLTEGKYYILFEPVVVEKGVLIERKPFESHEEEKSFFQHIKKKLKDIHRLDYGLYLYESSEFITSCHPWVVGRLVKIKDENCAICKLPEEWEGNKNRIAKGLQPINYLLPYGCGRYHEKDFSRLPLNLLFLTDSLFFCGMIRWMGYECQKIESEKPRELMLEMLEKAYKALKDFDGIFIYTDYIHRSNVQFRAWKRVEIIEDVDAAMAFVIDKFLSEDVVIMVSSDVTTPSVSSIPYSGLPVPVILAGEGVRRGIASKFDEAIAPTGSLGILRGGELLLTLLSYMGKISPTGF